MGAVLVVNAGSTSLKLHVVSDADDAVEVASLDAVRADDIDAVGHRVVHGGSHLIEATVIDDAVRASVAELESIAPLHNRPAIAGIDAATRAFPAVPHVAVFDTAFHATMPIEASTYALPRAWREEWGVRRFGFHGLSVQWCTERVRAHLERSQLRLVVCHLGGGCSVTAVRDGRSIDTTMGFSPLEGVPMATRSGSIDAGALLYLQRARGVSVDELDRALNEDSGLEGLSGLSGDIRELESAAAAGHADARMALAVYTYRIAGAVSAMAASLGGLDAVAFTAGVGEHSAGVRRAVCARLGFLGVELDDDLNQGDPVDADVSTATSAVRVLVVAAREELIVARAVRERLVART